MKEIFLDAAQMTDRAALHEAFAAAFGLDADYGRNLDALYDVLTSCPPTRLTLRHTEALVANLGNYGELVLRVLADGQIENLAFVLDSK